MSARTTARDDMTIRGSVWIMDPDDNTDAVIEGEEVRAEVEATDEDEVALHVMFPNADQAVTSFYLTRVQAAALAAVLSRRAVDGLGS